MKTSLRAADLLILVPIGIPFAYLFYQYNSLPSLVPVHFNIDGTADRFGNKSGLWMLLGIVAGISILVYLLIRFLAKIDSKKGSRYSPNTNFKIAVTVVLLLSIINCLIIRAAVKGSFDLGGVFPVIIGIFFAVIGNLMYNIKPNYFIGIRTPWTLENEQTWRKTHQFAGKLWFAGGLILAVLSLALTAHAAVYFLIAGLFILALVPVAYSYILFKNSMSKENS